MSTPTSPLDLIALNRFDEAKAVLDKARTLNLEGWTTLHLFTYYLAFLKGDSAEIEREASWGAGKPGAEDPLLSAQSDTEAYYGRLARALNGGNERELWNGSRRSLRTGRAPADADGNLVPVLSSRARHICWRAMAARRSPSFRNFSTTAASS
jgi:hypothetical protein